MVTEMTNENGTMIFLRPNRSLSDNAFQLHTIWLSTVFGIATLFFVVMSLWPISLAFALVWFFVLKLNWNVRRELSLEEHITILASQFVWERSNEHFESELDDTCVYAELPPQSWASVHIYVYSAKLGRCEIARLINREDGDRLIRILELRGIHVVRKRSGRYVTLKA